MSLRSDSCACGDDRITVRDGAGMVGPAGLTDVGPVTRVEFRVEDMDCASCLDTIRRSLERRPGIVGVEGSPISRRLEIDYDPATGSMLRRSGGT